MAYIIGEDRDQVQVVTVSPEDLIDRDDPVRLIVDTLDLAELEFVDGKRKGQSPYRRLKPKGIWN